MKQFFEKKGKRIIAFMLCALMLFVSLPISAWTGNEGVSIGAYYGERYVSIDGDFYYSNPDLNVLLYDNNGNTSIEFHGSEGPKVKFMFSDDTGAHQVYCLESGVSFGSGSSYTSENGNNSRYFKNLPMTAQFGICLTLMYGWQEGKASPVANTNEDDYAYATQILIWEYQQQLRTSPSDLHNNGSISADSYYISIKDRPAEKCYNWILERMANHYTIPSFATRNQNQANSYTLQYNPSEKNYSLTLIDTNNTLADIRFSVDGVRVSREGNKYTFTSDKMISDAVMVSAQKQVNVDCDNMLVWGCPGRQTMISGASDPVYFYLKLNTETYGNAHIKKTSEDNKVEDVSFTITGNGINETVTTTADGTVDIALLPGVYTVMENTADKYEPQSVQRITILSGQTSTVTFNNRLKCGDIRVIKSSEDGFKAGVKFYLSGISSAGITVEEYAVTDQDGIAVFKNVPISGSDPYTIEEVDTSIRYVIPRPQKISVNWNEVTNVTFTNVLKKWRATVTKSDSEMGVSQGSASLAGAIYGVYKGEQLIDTYTTDVNGQFATQYYVCGDDWSIREITPSEGYLLNDTIYHIGAEAKLYTAEYNSTTLDVIETVVKGQISLIKHCDNGETQIETPESGAQFEVFLKSVGSYKAAKDSERDYLTCDKNGFSETKKLPYGLYTVRQVSGWDGRELIKPFDVFINQDGKCYRYLINNARFESYIKIVKVDAETGKTIPCANAGFKLYRPDGSLITQNFTYPILATIDTFYTNDEGYLITPEKLEYGSGYSLVEVFAPYGYALNSDPVYFDVVQEASTDEGGVTVIEVVKPNAAQKGIIKISKSGEVFSSVTESKGMYQPIYSVQGLSGAVYEITVAEDIITPDGTLRASAGEVVDTITTDETGLAGSKPLYLGKYEIREIKAPYGMVLNTEIRTVEIVYAGQQIEITETATSFYNERQKAVIALDKILEQNEQFGIGMNNEITTVNFGLYTAKDLNAANGSAIPANSLLEIVSVDENGHAECKTDLPFGSFYLKELSTDEHYILSDEKYPIMFEYAGQETALVEIRANDGKPIDNDLICGEIHGLKKNEVGNALGGAVIGLFKSDTKEFTTDTAILTATSAMDGSFSFVNVPFGNWIVHEIEAPTGFTLSDESYNITIDEDGVVIDIEIKNTLICGNVQLIKVDSDYPDIKLTGAEFEVYRDSNCNKEYDTDDELLGTLTETSMGVYEMSDLPYGGYFIKESKAPDGFCLDENAYYFEITEHDKTVIVENEVGKGFVNAPQLGSLKIIKTSSDGRVEGFSFCVTGPNEYFEIFTTDKNGEIFIENLRVGEYAISEISDNASAGYILSPDKLANVLNAATTIVEMYNERKTEPKPVDNPKTGDENSLIPWIVLMGTSGTGAIVTSVIGKKRKEDIE